MDLHIVTWTKHWAVVVEYLDEDGSVDVSELYEADDNGQKIVLATNGALSNKTKKIWKKSPGT